MRGWETISRGLDGSTACAPSTNVTSCDACKFTVSPLNPLALTADFYDRACHPSHTISYMLTNLLNEGQLTSPPTDIVLRSHQILPRDQRENKVNL